MPSPVNPPSGCRFHTRCWLRERLGNPERLRDGGPGARASSSAATRWPATSPRTSTAPREQVQATGRTPVSAADGRPPGRRASTPPVGPAGAARSRRRPRCPAGLVAAGPRRRPDERPGGYAPDVRPLRIALAQIAPRLGALDANLARHHELLDEARADGADLVVFPELGLTGYLLQDLAAEVAMRLDDPRLAGARRGDRAGCRRSSRSSRSRPIIGCSSRPPCSRTARSATSIASCSCRPTACSTSGGSSPPGDVAAGRRRRGSGSGVGIAICEDFWHLSVPAAPGPRRRPDPHQRLVVAGARPRGDQRGRPRDGDVVADAHAHVRPADDVVRRLLQPGRRRRVDLVLGRLGGHRADRRRRSSARRSTTRACSSSTSRLADIRRERIALPLLRDERPGAAGRASSARIVAERAGLAPDSTADPGAEPGLDVAPASRTRRRSGSATPARGEPTRPTGDAADDRRPAPRGGRRPPFELPDELAIDTDVARRVIAEFIRGQLEQAGFERRGPGAVGRDRLGARRVPRRPRRSAPSGCCAC